MTRKHRALKVGCALLVCLALALGGCSDKSTGPEDAAYPDQSTPDNVIEKLEMVYEAMDVEAYMECLAEEFVFFLNPEDVAADPTLPEYWTKAEERVAHENMFGNNRVIESISLTLTVVSADSLPGEDPVDPSDDLWEYDTRFDLRIESGLPYFATGRVVLVMGRAPGRARTTWQVVEQHDLIQVQGWVQELTLTRVKLTFGGMDQDSLYPTRSSPENVLDKLTLAYIRMDAEAYLDCLAEDFIFFLSPDDVNDDPALPDHWDRVEEAIIHGNMFGEDTDVGGIMLVMTTNSASYDEGDPGDPLDDTWTYREDYDIRMQLPPDLTLHAQAPCEFTLGIDPDETGHGGQLLWEITRWYDLHVDRTRSGEPVVEHASWGCIKALFR